MENIKNVEAIQTMVLKKYKAQFDAINLLPECDETKTALSLMVLCLCVNVYLAGLFDGASQSADC